VRLFGVDILMFFTLPPPFVGSHNIWDAKFWMEYYSTNLDLWSERYFQKLSPSILIKHTWKGVVVQCAQYDESEWNYCFIIYTFPVIYRTIPISKKP
jgi:hypothetical protein